MPLKAQHLHTKRLNKSNNTEGLKRGSWNKTAQQKEQNIHYLVM